jgi:hypothetical protein
VPEISRFFGIVIRIFFNDHEPAHFHAVYGGFEVLLELRHLQSIAASYHNVLSHWSLSGPQSIDLSFAWIGNVHAKGYHFNPSLR